jgi:hypothetical protein
VERLPEHRREWVALRELLNGSPVPLALDADAEIPSAVRALAGNPLHRAAVARPGDWWACGR